MRDGKVARAACGVLLSLVLTGCGGTNGPSGEQPMMSIQEAAAQVDAYLERGRAALGPNTALTDDFRKDRMACDDPSDRGPAGRVFATRDAQVVGIEDPAKEAVFASLRAWWPSAGFREIAGQPDAIYAERVVDGFRMSLQTNIKGQFYLGVSSPCVWPEPR